MLETYLPVALLLLGLLLLFPGVRSTLTKAGRGAFYLTALVAILGWALLKSFVVLGARRLFRN